MEASGAGDKKIPDWLEDLAGRSYEPELIVSGAGIYLTAQLPELVNRFYYLFEANLLSENDSFQNIFALLIFGLLKTLALILVFTFIFHFAARAFWVGMLGLHSVYPQGILFGKLLNKSRQPTRLLAMMRLRIGSTRRFLIRLDRFCSGIFALAFLIGFTSISVSLLYAFVLVTVPLVRWITDSPQVIGLAPLLLLLILFLPMIIGYALYYTPRRWAKRRAIPFLWFSQVWVMPFALTIIQRISLTFQSHIPKGRFTVSSIAVGVVIILLWTWFLTMGIDGSRHFSINMRDFFSERNDNFTLHAEWYDDSRAQNTYIRHLSLPSEFVTKPILKVFLAYPKYLDRQIREVCGDTVATSKTRDSVNQYCLNRFYRIALNDSVLTDLEFFSHRHPNQGEKGLLLYIPISYLAAGKKHVLTVGYRTASDITQTNPDSLRYRVPFWYVPER